MSEKCVERVWRDHGYFPCSRVGTVERNARWYCRQHDPDARQQRLDARAAATRDKWATEKKKRRAEQLAVNFHQRLVDALRLLVRHPNSANTQLEASALLAEIEKEADKP